MPKESALQTDPLQFAFAVLRLVVAEELVVREAVDGQSLAGLNKFLSLFPLRGCNNYTTTASEVALALPRRYGKAYGNDAEQSLTKWTNAQSGILGDVDYFNVDVPLEKLPRTTGVPSSRNATDCHGNPRTLIGAWFSLCHSPRHRAVSLAGYFTRWWRRREGGQRPFAAVRPVEYPAAFAMAHTTMQGRIDGVMKNLVPPEALLHTTAPSSSAEACRPWSREDCLARVHTFLPSRWFSASHYLSPMTCARHGWCNVGVDTLGCTACEERLTYDGASSTTVGVVASSYEEEEARASAAASVFAARLVNGHSQGCPWRGNACPFSFERFPRRDGQSLVREFLARFRDFVALSAPTPALRAPPGHLPRISSLHAMGGNDPALEAFDLGGVAVRLLASTAAAVAAVATGEAAAADDTNVDTRSVQAAALLALFGWKVALAGGALGADGHGTQTANAGILQCEICGRRAGLWNFDSLGDLHSTAGDQLKSRTVHKTSGAGQPTGQRQKLTDTLKAAAFDSALPSMAAGSKPTKEPLDLRIVHVYRKSCHPAKGGYEPQLVGAYGYTDDAAIQRPKDRPILSSKFDSGWEVATHARFSVPDADLMSELPRMADPLSSSGDEDEGGQGNDFNPFREHRWFCPWVHGNEPCGAGWKLTSVALMLELHRRRRESFAAGTGGKISSLGGGDVEDTTNAAGALFCSTEATWERAKAALGQLPSRTALAVKRPASALEPLPSSVEGSAARAASAKRAATIKAVRPDAQTPRLSNEESTSATIAHASSAKFSSPLSKEEAVKRFETPKQAVAGERNKAQVATLADGHSSAAIGPAAAKPSVAVTGAALPVDIGRQPCDATAGKATTVAAKPGASMVSKPTTSVSTKKSVPTVRGGRPPASVSSSVAGTKRAATVVTASSSVKRLAVSAADAAPTHAGIATRVKNTIVPVESTLPPDGVIPAPVQKPPISGSRRHNFGEQPQKRPLEAPAGGRLERHSSNKEAVKRFKARKDAAGKTNDAAGAAAAVVPSTKIKTAAGRAAAAAAAKPVPASEEAVLLSTRVASSRGRGSTRGGRRAAQPTAAAAPAPSTATGRSAGRGVRGRGRGSRGRVRGRGRARGQAS